MKLFSILILMVMFLFQGCGSSGGDTSTSDTTTQDDGGDDTTQDGNSAPIASNVSLSSDLTTPYVRVSMSATDSDSDTLSYQLQSPYEGTSGSGYEYAFVDPGTDQLYVLLKSDYTNNTVELRYKASDSIEFSNEATVTINIQENTDNSLGYDEENEDISAYASTQLAYFSSTLGGDFQSNETSLPSSVDLSPSMPTPGNQGSQGSCVGWATAYALKSYQEKVEMGWSLNSEYTLFSPAYIYNQINGGRDGGSLPSDALQLMIDKGAATLAMMPYSDRDFTTQPTSAINEHAANFKALAYRKVSGTSQIKAALANRNAVTVGIKCYSSINNVNGSDPVYDPNPNYETDQGGHAVTIAGYDDGRYGGAFKIINSWGINWGDNGYFWLPYDKVSDVMLVSYVLTDQQNGDSSTTVDIDDIPEPIRDDLPNLEVEEWGATYDTNPGGAGELTYSILNSGTGTASAGFDVNLMLSEDDNFNSSDIFVIYEEIPFDLYVGEAAYRDDDNTRSFNFPETIKAGTYYMAVWVDDLDEVDESNERDNISVGDNTVRIESSLPDVSIESWGADWYWTGGAGTLEYRVCNDGATATTSTTWDINLMLSTTPNPADDSNHYFLFYEDVYNILQPDGGCSFRDSNNTVSFNLYEDHWGDYIPNGTYYMSLWVDDQDLEEESNEINNYSTGNNNVTLTSSRSSTKNIPSTNANGKQLKVSHIKKVVISEDSKGKRSFKIVENYDTQDTKAYYQKTISSKNETVFPVVKKYAMPKIVK